ncbi:MAG: hypothetical protein JHC63_04540 [Acidimicrobiia bacterium]|nr:hypothetical protein [Acidimicrobiia bacterium]
MLDHVFTDAIGALRDAFEGAMLERQAFEERFNMDMLLGDMTWETTYGLPGEGIPPRVQADLTLTWPTWAQTAYRSWYIGESFDETPRIDIELVLRVQRLSSAPDPAALIAALPDTSPAIGQDRLERSGPTVETIFEGSFDHPEYAIEVSYEGSYEVDEETLADGTRLDDNLGAMGGWISSILVKVGDLGWDFLPAIDQQD